MLLTCAAAAAAGREKVIHSVGAVALAEFVVTDNSAGYSGIFATGSVTALLRMSTAKFHGGASTCPGASMKFFRTGTTRVFPAAPPVYWRNALSAFVYARAGLPSVNAFAIDSVFSQQTCNFFAVCALSVQLHPRRLRPGGVCPGEPDDQLPAPRRVGVQGARGEGARGVGVLNTE